jgi:hypothetical protein
MNGLAPLLLLALVAGSSACRGSAGESVDGGATPAACVSPNDCPGHFGPQVYCCLDHACTADVPDACADANIQASHYDQSCTTDSDCVGISEGCWLVNPCKSTAAINQSAYAQYQADITKLPCFGVSTGCLGSASACCRDGTCRVFASCNSPTTDTLPACADAGGICALFGGQCGSKGEGPPDSCAYSDETCCLQ